MAVGYRVVSWILSLAVVFFFSLAAFAVAAAFMRADLALLAFFGVLVALVGIWRRSSRRYGAPLVRLVPRSEYRRFADWQAGRDVEPATHPYAGDP